MRSISALGKLNNYINRSINQYSLHYFVFQTTNPVQRSEPPINFIDNMVIFWWPSCILNWNEFSNRISRYFVPFFRFWKNEKEKRMNCQSKKGRSILLCIQIPWAGLEFIINRKQVFPESVWQKSSFRHALLKNANEKKLQFSNRKWFGARLKLILFHSIDRHMRKELLQTCSLMRGLKNL